MKSLYVRMCLVFCSVVLISGILAFLVSNLHYQSITKAQNDAKLTAMAAKLQQFLQDYPEAAEDYLTSTAALGYKIWLTDGTPGSERSYGLPFRETDLPEGALELVLDGNVYHGVREFSDGPFVTGFFDNQLRNSIGVPLVMEGGTHALFMRPDAQVQFGELRGFFALLIGFILLFSLGFLMIAVFHIVRPITRLTEATKKIASGRYDIRLYTARRDEIGQLATHFMKMSRELERTEKTRKDFVANVSHEIESPLTSIQGFAHELRDDNLPQAQRNEYLAIIEEESRRLSALGKQLLTLSMLDHKGEALAFSPVELRGQLRRVLQMMEWRLADKELAVTFRAEEASVAGDADLLHQVWVNLLSNAVKFTPPGGSISITGMREDMLYAVKVADSGAGLSPGDLPYVFDRFYKADQARTRADSGTGLGLAIARSITEAHGGTIEAASEPGRGAVFTVRLPVL